METTARFELPLLAVAQAAKEITVNEALTLLDAAVQPVVQGVAGAPPASPAPGEGWLVASGASGAFIGRGDAIAVWTSGGWRFVIAIDGMIVWRRDTATMARYGSSGWQSGSPVTLPSGGTVIDVEARAAIADISSRIRQFGVIAS